MIFKKLTMEFAQYNLSNLEELRKMLKDSYEASSGPYGDVNTSLDNSVNRINYEAEAHSINGSFKH
jgi:hypothetical protein